MSVISPQRTTRIIEQVAARHGLEVRTLLCANNRRDVTRARGELVWWLKTELGLSFREIGAKIGRCPASVCSYFHEHKKQRNLEKRILPPPADEEARLRIRELEHELERLSGTLLCERLKQKLGLRLRYAIGLAIITEAFPRVVRGPAMLHLYDDACTALGYGHAREGANYRLMDKNMSELNAHFIEHGWPTPALPGEGRGSRYLSHDAAAWMAENCSAPRWAVVLSARQSALAYGSQSIRAAGAM